MSVPYPLTAAVHPHKRHAQMAIALQTGYPFLESTPIEDGRSLTIACYGPSLAQTYQSMTRPILSMSGATRWLADHGVVPDYHLDMDPREHKVKHLDPAVNGVHYLMATVCHPKTWPLLQGQRVTLWHTYSSAETSEWVAAVDQPGRLVIRGGSTIGLTALHIGGILGYRHFEIHGMDGSFADDQRSARHAGIHYGTTQQDGITWQVNHKQYQTSKIMANAVTETLNAVSNFPMFCVFHGDGLTQALVRKRQPITACCADEVEKAARLRNATAHVLDKVNVSMDQIEAASSAVWDVLCDPVSPDLITEMTALHQQNEPRRAKAAYNTGSITIPQMVQLRQLSEKHQPKVAVEIGTFIGNSTCAIQAQRIYTCDKDNDCFNSDARVICFPKTGSTRMLEQLVRHHVKAEFFFFDGRIQMEDLPLIEKLMTPDTLFVFDDYNTSGSKDRPQKGIINAKRLASVLPDGWVLVEPDPRVESTLACLVPRHRLMQVAA